MKKGILSEIQNNRQMTAQTKVGVAQKSLQKISNKPQQQKIMPLKIGMKQNLKVNCNDDDGIDLTKFDSNTCIDQGNDSKYENYGNDHQVQEIYMNNDFYLSQNKSNGNILKSNNCDYSFHNNSNNFSIPDMLKNHIESSRNINKTFSVMDSIYDDEQVGPRSVNKETVNEIMKTMPKSAQQILQRIMGRNTEDGSKVTLNPSQNDDYLDEQSINVSSLNSILMSSTKKIKDQSGILSYSQQNEESYLQNQGNVDILHHTPISNKPLSNQQSQKENKTTYQKILQGKQQGEVKKVLNSTSQNKLNQNKSQSNQLSSQLLQQPQKKITQSKNFNQNGGMIKQKQPLQNPIQNLTKLKEQNPLANYYEQNKQFDTDFDDFSFELENLQKRIIGNSTNTLSSKSNQPQKQLKNASHSDLKSLDSFLVGYNNDMKEDQYISNQAAKYQSVNYLQTSQRNQDDIKTTSQRGISPVSSQKQQMNKNNQSSKSRLNKSKETFTSCTKTNSKGRISNLNKSPKSGNQQNNEITFAVDRNNLQQNDIYLNQQHQLLLQQLLSKNQKNVLGGFQDQKPQSSFFSRSISPQQQRSESVGNSKNQKSIRALERCASSLSQHNNQSNDRSTSSFRDGGLSAKSSAQNQTKQTNNYNSNRVQSYINRIKNSNSTSSVKNSNTLLRSKTQETFFAEKSKTVNPKCNQKSYQKLHSKTNLGIDERAQSQDTSNRNRNSKTSGIQERPKSQLNIDRLDTYFSITAQKISPTFTSLSVTSNSKKIIKSPTKTSIYSNLDRILKAGRSKSPTNQEKLPYEKSRTQLSQEKFKEVSKKPTSKDALKKLTKKNSTIDQSNEKLNSLLRTGRVSSYFSERPERKSLLASSQDKLINQKNNNLRAEQKPNAMNNNVLNQVEQKNQGQNVGNKQGEKQKIVDLNIQKIEQQSPNISLSNQIALLAMLQEQQQSAKIPNHINNEDIFSSSKILQSFELTGNNYSNQFLNSFSNNQQNNSNQPRQFFHGGSFFNENSFGGQDKSQQDSPINIHSKRESKGLEFESHISSISQDSYRNYENLEPRAVDSKTVNEIMKSMPSSAQQILQRIMSRGTQDASQIMINPTQMQNSSLPINFSFDIEQEIPFNKKNELQLQKMTSSIIPQQDPGSIREYEDNICKQSNSTDIEQIVKHLNFENNSSSFATSSNDKRGRSSSLSKSFSSNSKDKQSTLNSNFLLNSNHPNPCYFNMTEDDLRLEARLQSLDKLINLSDNQQKQGNNNVKCMNESTSQRNYNKKLNNSYSQKHNRQQNVSEVLPQNLNNQSKSSLCNQQNNTVDKENEQYSLSNLSPEQIQILEELSKQQLLEISKKQLNSSQQSIKSSSSKSNKSALQLKKKQQQDNENNESQQFQQPLMTKPALVINPPVPKQFQNITKSSNGTTGNNVSLCNMSQQSYESFSSASTKPQPSAAYNNSTSKKSINYYSNQKKSQKITSNKTLDRLNHSSQSTEVSTQIMQQNSLTKLKCGSKFNTEDSLAIEKSDFLLQSNQINQQGQFMIFKPQMSQQLASNNLNKSSERIKKLNDTLSSISAQLTINQPVTEQRAQSLQTRQIEKTSQQIISQRSGRKESLNNQYNSASCTSLSAVPNISQNSVLNRSLRDIQSSSVLEHQKETCAQGQDFSYRSSSSAHKDNCLPNQSSQQRITRSNTCDLISSQITYQPNQEVGQKRWLEDLQLTVNEKEAEIISLKLQVQDLQEVLEKQKFLQSSQKKVQKKRYNEIEEKIISSRINIDSQIPNQSGSTKSVNSVKSAYSEIKNEQSEQKFCETYPKNMLFINSTLKKKENIVKDYSSVKSIKNLASSNKKDLTLTSNDDTEGSHLKLNASEIDLTYQINQFTIIKNINHQEDQNLVQVQEPQQQQS